MTVIGYVADNLAIVAVADSKFYFAVLALGAAFAGAHVIMVWEARNRLLRILLGLLVLGTFIVTVPALVGKFVSLSRIKPEVSGSAEQSAPLIAESTTLMRATYADKRLSGSRLSGTRIEQVDFNAADLSESDLREVVMVDVNMAGANLCGADIRGADLKEALGLNRVANWNFVIYDDKTQVPAGINIHLLAGPVIDTGEVLLYSCEPNKTRQILKDGSRK